MFLDFETLVNRIVSAVDGPRPVVFLVGSGVTLPRPGTRGVPSSNDVVEIIRKRLPPNTLQINATYQQAFEILVRLRGQDAANSVIRDAVLNACKIKPSDLSESSLANLELDWASWDIPRGLTAFAAMAAHHPISFGTTLITTNFDPLVEISMTRAGIPWNSTSLHSDGSLLYLRGSGTKIVHLHGYWLGSDTLHTPSQLSADRPQLQASLKRILSNSLLVVVGYGGWQDIFTEALGKAVAENDISVDLLWCFYSEDENQIMNMSSSLIDKLRPASDRGRAHFYKGIDFDKLTTQLFERICKSCPAQSLQIYFDRVLYALSRREAYRDLTYPWGSDTASFGEFAKPLEGFSRNLCAQAALEAVGLMLPYLEAQPIHQAPDPQRHAWIRGSLDRATKMLDLEEPTWEERSFCIGSAIDALRDAGKAETSQERVVLTASAYALAAVMATLEGGCDLEGERFPQSYWAARAIHLIARSSYDQESHLALHLKSRLRKYLD